MKPSNTHTEAARTGSVGGSDFDTGLALTLGAQQLPYVTGRTLSTDFPVFNAYQGQNAGGFDAYIAKNLRAPVLLFADEIDQDDPTNTQWKPASAILYGGSIPATADNLRLTLVVAQGLPAITSVSWSADGNGAEEYTPPQGGSVWRTWATSSPSPRQTASDLPSGHSSRLRTTPKR
jgi:hypothetical protein